MAKIITIPPVSDFLLAGDPTDIEVKSNPQLDVSYWIDNGKVMVALANIAQTPSNGSIAIKLPMKVSKILSQPWGSLSWYLDKTGKLCTSGLEGLATSIVVLES